MLSDSVRGTSDMQQYVDGIEWAGTYDGTGTAIGYGTDTGFIGRGDVGQFDGQVYAWAVWERALTDAEHWLLGRDPLGLFRQQRRVVIEVPEAIEEPETAVVHVGSTRTRRKPQQWAVTPGEVDPDWQSFWQGLIFAAPLWEGGGETFAYPGHIPGTFQATPEWARTDKGWAIALDGPSREWVQYGTAPPMWDRLSTAITVAVYWRWDGSGGDNWSKLFEKNNVFALTRNGTGTELYSNFWISGTQRQAHQTTNVGFGNEKLMVGSWQSGGPVVATAYDPSGKIRGTDSSIDYSGTLDTDGATQLNIGSASDENNDPTATCWAAYVWNRRLDHRELGKLARDPFGPFRKRMVVPIQVPVAEPEPEKSIIRVRAIEPPSRKPQQWILNPAGVAEEWRPLWKGLGVCYPLWEGSADVREYVSGLTVDARTAGDPKSEPTRYGHALHCTADAKYIDVTTGREWAAAIDHDAVSFFVLIRPGADFTPAGDPSRILSLYNNTDGSYGTFIGWDHTGQVGKVRITTDSDVDVSSSTIAEGTIAALGASYDGKVGGANDIKIYLNGRLSNQGTSQSGVLQALQGDLTIHTLMNSNDDGSRLRGFPGYLYVAYGWNRALTAAEHARLARDPFGLIRPARPIAIQAAEAPEDISAVTTGQRYVPGRKPRIW